MVGVEGERMVVGNAMNGMVCDTHTHTHTFTHSHRHTFTHSRTLSLSLVLLGSEVDELPCTMQHRWVMWKLAKHCSTGVPI